MDPAQDVSDPVLSNVHFLNTALWDSCGGKHFLRDADPMACRLTDDQSMPQVRCADIRSIMLAFGVRIFDAVKLDIEGAEYQVLKAWPGPIAKQISVEFHPHFCKDKDLISAARAQLDKWYTCVENKEEIDHLFVLRESNG